MTGSCITAFAEFEPGTLLDKNRMADIFEVNEKTIRRWEKEGVIPCGVKMGSNRMWVSDLVLEHIKSKSKELTDKAAANLTRVDSFVEDFYNG